MSQCAEAVTGPHPNARANCMRDAQSLPTQHQHSPLVAVCEARAAPAACDSQAEALLVCVRPEGGCEVADHAVHGVAVLIVLFCIRRVMFCIRRVTSGKE